MSDELDELLPYERAERMRSQIFPCSLCGGRVKPWCNSPGATAHDSCAWRLAEQMRTLAHNLAAAALGCAAFALGEDNVRHRPCGDGCDFCWSPGCGKAAP